MDRRHLDAANLGDDADTTAAVCGQVAGAFYGVQGIREDWLQQLALRAEIEKLAAKLYLLASGYAASNEVGGAVRRPAASEGK